MEFSIFFHGFSKNEALTLFNTFIKDQNTTVVNREVRRRWTLRDVETNDYSQFILATEKTWATQPVRIECATNLPLTMDLLSQSFPSACRVQLGASSLDRDPLKQFVVANQFESYAHLCHIDALNE